MKLLPIYRRRLPAAHRSVGALAGRLLLELLVVFLGVSAAFMLSEHQKAREQAERRTQMQQALQREVAAVVVRTRSVAEQVPALLAAHDARVAAGERPIPQPMTEPVRVQAHIWEAALASGALELFDVAMLVQLSAFYNELNAGFVQLEQLRALSETVLIPNLDRGPDEFYEADGVTLRQKYHWHRAGMERLGQIAREVTALGDALEVQLRAGPAPRR